MRIYRSMLMLALLAPAVVMAAPQSEAPSPRVQAMLQKLQQKFEAADSNHDGKLTLAEAQPTMPRIAQHFADIDTDHAGYITLDQIKAYLASRASQ